MEKVYMCIDLKSFYASVECVERHLNPLDTNLVVADDKRTDKTICLAVTPSLKSLGLGGRCRLFEAEQKVKEINSIRRKNISNNKFKGKSYIYSKLKNNKYLEVDFICATPRMKLYMKYSTLIYNIYLKYIAPEDILVYSIDEVFVDITPYLKLYKKTKEELVMTIIKDVYMTTGITATAGIGTNMYLAKVAMDITAKKMQPNSFGVRMSYLDEESYKKTLWTHTPITDFWRVGVGYATRLAHHNMYTMGDVARMSLTNEKLLYDLFGVNAEFLIDHAWGYEPTTIKDAKNYKPTTNSISEGQVLHHPYDYDKTKIILTEMIDSLSLTLASKHLVTDMIVLNIDYDTINVTEDYTGEITLDHYGRKVPKHSHGTITIDLKTRSTTILTKELLKLYERISEPYLLVRRVNIALCNLIDEDLYKSSPIQLDLFDETSKDNNIDEKINKALVDIKLKYGKNSILKGINYVDGSTLKQRNTEVGGHNG